jgi:hypothetical protein
MVISQYFTTSSNKSAALKSVNNDAYVAHLLCYSVRGVVLNMPGCPMLHTRTRGHTPEFQSQSKLCDARPCS